jgi:hypothetical protein
MGNVPLAPRRRSERSEGESSVNGFADRPSREGSRRREMTYMPTLTEMSSRIA